MENETSLWTGEKRYAEFKYEVGKIYNDTAGGCDFICDQASVTYNPNIDRYPVHYYSYRWIKANGKPGKRGFTRVGYIFDLKNSLYR